MANAAVVAGARPDPGGSLARAGAGVLGNSLVDPRPRPEDFPGGSANAIGATVQAVRQPARVRTGDEVAAALSARMALVVMQFNVPADFLSANQDLTV